MSARILFENVSMEFPSPKGPIKVVDDVSYAIHDREFVSSIATRVVGIKASGVIDFRGSYDAYLRSRGIAIDLQRAASQ